MKIVIDMPDDAYNILLEEQRIPTGLDYEYLIMHGTPLPKGHRWIPVSERLPEEREWMGTRRFGTTISDEVYVTLETPDGERFTKHLSFQNGGLSQTDQERMRVWFKGAVPIAWMPLPTPYEP